MTMAGTPGIDTPLQWAVRAAIALAVTVLALLALSGQARATVDIESFATTSTDPQAGGHPDLNTSFALASPGEPEAAQTVIFNAPTGVFGNPNAVTRCPSDDFALTQCTPNSQAGLVTVTAKYNGNPNYLLGTVPLYDLAPQGEEPGRFAFVVPILNIPVSIPVTVRTGSDYGLRFTVSSITQTTPLSALDLTVWGMPAAPINRPGRFAKGTPGNSPACIELADTSCFEVGADTSIPVRPLIDNPTRCTGEELETTLDVETYQDPGNFSHSVSSYPAVTGCENETFNPVFFSKLTTNETDAASGLDLTFKALQTLGTTPAASEVRTVVVELPNGLTINPDAADGQSACTDAQADFGSEAPANCPDNAKIGTVSIGTPALDGPLTGSIYFGQPQPGNQYRLFLIADGFGIHAKLEGSFFPDPGTGQLRAVFEDLPQVPFDTFDVHLFASDRGLLATPTKCTIYTARSRFTPWNATIAPQISEESMSLDSGPNGTPCPGQVRPFNPRLVAGGSNPVAGAFSDFHLKLDRDDGDQFLGDLTFRMPPGFTGDLRGIKYCPEAAIAAAAQNLGVEEVLAPSCPADSQIGTTNVAAGPGGHPFHAVGKMYLAGPLKGAPLSVVAVTPALAGPYDYGVVVVRVALHVDPLTAQVFAASDTVPSIIGGVPIRMRSIQVNIDRPNFTINPTNCSPFSVNSQGIGDQGTVTNFSSYFHAVNCGRLAFKPKMAIRRLGGPKAAKRAKNPAVQFDLRTRPGDANIKSLSVTLSHAFEIDQRHLGNICSEKELAEKQCAGRTPIGKASTTTPLLDQPLTGPVYAVSGGGGLPRLAFILNGQVNLVPRAETTTVNGRLKTTVPVVPDAPIGHFRLNVFGGKTGYLITTRDVCVHPPVTKVDYEAQSGKSYSEKVKLKASCGKSKARHKRGARR
jgi:hypothetical protein